MGQKERVGGETRQPDSVHGKHSSLVVGSGMLFAALVMLTLIYRNQTDYMVESSDASPVATTDLSEIVRGQHAIQTQLTEMDYTKTPKPTPTNSPTETPYPAYPAEDATPNGLYALYARPIDEPPAPDIETTLVLSDCSEINTPKVGFTICRAPTLTLNEGLYQS